MAPNLKEHIKLFSDNFPPNILKIQAYTIINGVSQHCDDQEIQVFVDPVDGIIKFSYRFVDYSLSYQTVTWPQILILINKISLATGYADYRSVKRTLIFRHVYHYAKRKFPVMKNGSETTKEFYSFPCLQCGLIVPEDLITIDHHHPQSGGEIKALLKVFRACWLTEAQPKGILGKFFFKYASISDEHLISALLTPDIWPKVEFPYDPTDTNFDGLDGQTLSHLGSILYSVFLWSNDIQQIMDSCMRSMLNLKPLCMKCNSSKGND